MLTFDSRLLHDYDTRALFGGYTDRLTIYEQGASIIAKREASATTGDILLGFPKETNETRGLGEVPAACSPSSSNTAVSSLLQVPWSLAIFGGSGLSSIGVSIKVLTYDKQLNLEGRANIVSLTGTLALPSKISAAISKVNSGSFGNKFNCPICPKGQYRNDVLQCVACPKEQTLISNERLMQMLSQRMLVVPRALSSGSTIINAVKVGRAGDIQSTCFPKAQAQQCPHGQLLAPPGHDRHLSSMSNRDISNGWTCVPCPNGVCNGGNGPNGAASSSTSSSNSWPSNCPQPVLQDCAKSGLGAARLRCEGSNRLIVTKARAACSAGLSGKYDCSRLVGSSKAACVAKYLGAEVCSNSAGGMVAAACDCASKDSSKEKALCAASTVAGLICDKQTDARKLEICKKAKSCIGMSGKELGACAASTAGLAACSMIVKDPTALDACKAAVSCIQGKSVRETAMCAGQGAANAICQGKLSGTSQTGCIAASQCIGLIGQAARDCAKSAVTTTETAICQNNVKNTNLQTGCVNAAKCASESYTKKDQGKCLSDAACSTLGGNSKVQGCQQALLCRNVPAAQRTKCLEDAATTACEDISNINLRVGCEKGTQCAGSSNKKACLGESAVTSVCARLSGPANQGCQQGIKCLMVADKRACLASAVRIACGGLSGTGAQTACSQGAQCAINSSPVQCLRNVMETSIGVRKSAPAPCPQKGSKSTGHGCTDSKVANLQRTLTQYNVSEDEDYLSAGFDALSTALAIISGLEVIVQADVGVRALKEALFTAELALGYKAISEVQLVLHSAGVE